MNTLPRYTVEAVIEASPSENGRFVPFLEAVSECARLEACAENWQKAAETESVLRKGAEDQVEKLASRVTALEGALLGCAVTVAGYHSRIISLKTALADLLEAATMAPRLDTETPIVNPHAVKAAHEALDWHDPVRLSTPFAEDIRAVLRLAHRSDVDLTYNDVQSLIRVSTLVSDNE